MVNRISWILLFSVFTLACAPAIKTDRRTPLLPVFPRVSKDDYAKTNPYFSGVTGFFDKQKLKLSDGKIYRPQSPTLVGPIGTFYEYPERFYFYAMTDGGGVQWDVLRSQKQKVAVGALVGDYENYGVQLIAAHEMNPWEFPITGYLSLQRRSSRVSISCYSERGSPCAGNDHAYNRIRVKEDLFNPLFGVQFGRFLLKRNTRTTAYFKLELGSNQILSKKIIRQDFASDFQHSDGSFVNFEAGFTLW